MFVSWAQEQEPTLCRGTLIYDIFTLVWTKILDNFFVYLCREPKPHSIGACSNDKSISRIFIMLRIRNFRNLTHLLTSVIDKHRKGWKCSRKTTPTPPIGKDPSFGKSSKLKRNEKSHLWLWEALLYQSGTKYPFRRKKNQKPEYSSDYLSGFGQSVVQFVVLLFLKWFKNKGGIS